VIRLVYVDGHKLSKVAKHSWEWLRCRPKAVYDRHAKAVERLARALRPE
jgi:hypothetical protein